MRKSEIKRKTSETSVALSLDLDKGATGRIDTGCGFLDHMLTLFASHSGFGLSVNCSGDTQVDYHHTTEDIAICLGTAFKEAIGDKRGIKRYGDITLPMDEALILAAVDISGRGMCRFEADIPTQKVGDFDTELVNEFFVAFASRAEITLHIREICGSNSHHIIEGCFKAFARALAKAAEIDESRSDAVPSTKGVL